MRMRGYRVGNGNGNACRIAGLLVGVIVLLGVVANLPDIAKYVKLKSM